MSDSKAKKEEDYAWDCNFCGEQFSSKKKAEEHELSCNPSDEVLQKNASYVRLAKPIVTGVKLAFGFWLFSLIFFLLCGFMFIVLSAIWVMFISVASL